MIGRRPLRIATLIVPSIVAAAITMRSNHEHLLHAAFPALVALWAMMAGALALRFVEPVRSGALDRRSRWHRLDVLTSTGTAMMWMGAGALVAGGLTGWASLSVIGILGLATVYLAATWTTLAAGGDVPWRHATITRSILPEVAIEGDPVREEIRLSGVKIPSGMNLFAIGRTTRHGCVTRYVVGSEGSGADVKLESDLGAARRGEHHAPALGLWLGDVLGLTRTPFVHRGEASFLVLPRLGPVDGVKQLLGQGGDDARSHPTHRLPTEGTFRIREYAAGDDTRRIHWVRSLQTNQLVVRLPDEIPPAEPMVRLILDNHLGGTESLTTRAPDELLDALVRVWLGIAKQLAETGTRVTLVTAAMHADAIAPGLRPPTGTPAGFPPIAAIERPMLPRSSREALRLGGRIAWQGTLPLAGLLARGATRQVVVSSRSQPLDTHTAADVSWVVVPDVAWTSREPQRPASAPVRLAFPSGTADNRFGHRAREVARIEAMWRDRIAFTPLRWTNWRSFSGSLVARPDQGRIALTVIP